MSLLKKIGTIFAAGALSFGLASNIMATDSKSNIEKEAERYKNLQISGDDYNVFTWEMSNPSRELICEYEVIPYDDFDFMNLKKMTGKNWEADKKEYQEFFLTTDSDIIGDYLYLEKDSDNDGVADKRYCYVIGTPKKIGITLYLSRIIEDKNRDGKYSKDEIVWDE